jgi:enoyl-CoA hydratase/carnithine racemase
LIDGNDAVNLDKLFKMEAQRFSACYATNEPVEGIAAFLEKRPAGWGTAPSPR